jgi:hypothetical protein
MSSGEWQSPSRPAVSRLFYNNKLRVASPSLSDPKWLAERVAGRSRLLPDSNVVLLDTLASAEPSLQYIGYMCRQTAELAAALTVDLKESFPDEEVLILTPYRAQRRAIQAELRSVNSDVSIASTVHRAQGSERRTVIVDLVKPSAEFVNGPEGRRLINVAFSRAECRLVIMLQIDWRDNQVLSTLASTLPITSVDGAEVQRLLLRKLPTQKPSNALVATAKQQPTPQVRTLAEEFYDDLLEALRSGPHTAADRKRRIQEVAWKRKYDKKLGYAEIDRQTALVLNKLPPRS